MIYILLSLVMLVVSDGLITQFLTEQGLAMEGNPFLQSIVGEGKFLLVKVAGGLLATLILWDVYKAKPRMALVGSAFLMVIYTGIIFWNLAVFFISRA